ncbi:hypothetical protein LOTGIDRAFT_236548 [Lottia gigantea]|uniref:Uncharacterized protein n=1 Tax=Lottia gigantea TaxID=225164 RepID=V3ZM54_LOTGI|nr:hypothetical protein LOTGIDRAFT_236548 [Lottia gigantea]ESO83520.1 hypothetical protein LOTGIDRAFT_236548 [Lottia gigantea]
MGAACTTNTTALNGSVTSLNDNVNIIKILLTGPSKCGKSYLLSKWLYGFESDDVKGSNDFNMKKVTSRTGQVFTVWEISSKPNLKSIRRNMFYGTQGMVYVVRNIEENKEYWMEVEKDINSLLLEPELKDIPTLIVLNQSQTNGILANEVKSKINLPADVNRKWSYYEVHSEQSEEIDNILMTLESLLNPIEIHVDAKS